MQRNLLNALCAGAIVFLARTSCAQQPAWFLPGADAATHRTSGELFQADWPAPAPCTGHSDWNCLPGADGRGIGYRTPSPQQILGPGTYPTVQVTGFFQADAGSIHQSSANRAAVGDAQDGADFRRARLQAVGDAWDNVGYSIEFDFAFPGRPNFMDVWLELRDLSGGASLRVGQYRQPIGMDGLTSVKELTFIERALPFALLPFRQIGGMLHGTANDDGLTWALSLYRFPTDTFGGNVGDNGGYALATRVTALAIDAADDCLLHIGGAFSFADPSNDAVRYLSQPEFFLAETGGAALTPAAMPSVLPAFVDSGVIPTQNVSLFGAELASQLRSLHLESELLVAIVNQPETGSAVFPGAYVQTGYVLTGESRPYNRTAGVLSQIEPAKPFGPSGGCGAWEVAVRWSYLDLNASAVRGGTIHDVTIGLNWYLNLHTKIQFNYIRALLDSPVNGKSDAGITALRAQLDF